jgi:para-nitrobenzyl esterase
MTDEIVETTLGKLKGKSDGRVVHFLGIPYASPPVGERRFQKTQPHPGWEGILDASEYGASAWQKRKMKQPCSENCLYLNIWAPAAPGEKRAVMFYIHGGGFTTGSGSDEDINGARLSKNEDVVVVTVNYRLNVLGFLDFSFLGDTFTPNCGLYDIIEALKFVYENIGAFSGDKDNITVFGQSAGAIAISVLVTLPEANRYISRAIMMSSCPTLINSRKTAWEIGQKYLDFAGIKNPEELRARSAEELTLSHPGFSSRCGVGAGTFTIVRDGTLVRDYPIQALQKGRAGGIPMLIGTTREELSILLIKPLAAILDIDGIVSRGVQAEEKEVTQEIVSTYEKYSKRKGAIIGLSDMAFRVASMWYAEACSEHAETWAYRFDYSPPAMKVIRLYAVHSSDIPFVFGNFNKGLGRLMFFLACRHKKRYMRVHREFRTDFCTFAKTGKLPWNPVFKTDTVGKCYDVPSHIGPVIAAETMDAYAKTNYRKRSFYGENDCIDVPSV